MNYERAPEWLPTFLIPFFTLSYPVPTPAAPDSFPTSHYYVAGLLDGCILITSIAVMAILRDVTRLFIMEPFAQWYLTRHARHEAIRLANSPSTVPLLRKQSDGLLEKKTDAGHLSKRQERQIRRNVLRFAEQSWSMIYYSCLWSYGLVSQKFA